MYAWLALLAFFSEACLGLNNSEIILDGSTLESIVSGIEGQYGGVLENLESHGGGGQFEIANLGSHLNFEDLKEPPQWVDPQIEGIHEIRPQIYHFTTPDGGLHTYENTLSVEASGVKLVVSFLALFYILLLLYTQMQTCDSNPPPHPTHPPTVISADPPPLPPPHPLQDEINQLFLKHSSSSEEEEDVPSIISEVSAICPTNSFFYSQNGAYMSAAMKVRDMLMGIGDPMMMLEMAMRIKPSMNNKLWFTAMLHAKHQRRDMDGMMMPSVVEAMPDMFMEGVGGDHDGECVKVDGKVGKDNGVENRLWYFREDVMTNSHHWYWHLSYPLMTTNRLDRRGELFYHTHRSMLFRYNIERLCNGLEPAEGMDYDEAVTPGYNPHLTDHNAGMDWTPRDKVTFIRDVMHQMNQNDMVEINIRDWRRVEGRLWRAIESGQWVVGKTTRKIPEKTGIDELGNTLEAVDISVNPMYYNRDGFHNNGHRILAYIEDPDYRKKLPPGVMGDPATAMRDPIFYRFHTNVNDMFEKYKATLKPYEPSWGSHALHTPGLYLHSIQLNSQSSPHPNLLRTFFTKRSYPLNMGLAFNNSEEVKVCAKHLDHEEFEYEFQLYRAPCAKSKSNSATFRVFIAPKFNHKGERLTIQQQRKLFVHLDLFNVKIPFGWSTIKRHSTASSLTIPYQSSLAQINTNGPMQPNCGCGWPHHLLLPKGTKEGMDFDIFVIATDGDDYIEPKSPFCSKAFIYCGANRELYPDKRPMGYPFDRQIYMKGNCGAVGGLWYKICRIFGGKWKIGYVEDFVEGVGNMGVVGVRIVHGKS